MKNWIVKLVVLLCFALLAAGGVFARQIKGRVVNMQNEPISYVSIYIKELSMGTSTNEQGEFEIQVEDGTYTCYFQHLSHEMTTVSVKTPSSQPLVVKLPDKIYDLPMISIGTKQEDPAYDMIRKAIGMAPFYRNQLDAYRAEVYIKGTLKIDKISGVVKMMARKELKNAKIKEGERYLYESLSELSLKNGKFVQNVKSVSNTFPADMNFNVGLANYNIYQTEVAGIISPLSPQALSHYSYKYEGFSVEGSNIVNRIKVTPKRKNKMTLNGYIYLSEGFWNVHRFELSGEAMGAQFTNRQSYGELETNVWMPISNNFDVSMSMVGNKGSATYVSSMKYRDFVVNPSIKNKTATLANVPKTQAAPIKTQSVKSKKLEQQIDEIVNKGSISNREAYNLSRLAEKKKTEDRKALPDSLRGGESLNLSEKYVFKTDSMAKQRDTNYWNTIRPIPLMSEEIVSYKRLDSMRTDKEQPDSLQKKSSNILKPLLPSRYYIGDSTLRLSYDGLISPLNLAYNVVDGFTYKQALNARKMFLDSTSLYLGLSGKYAFARKRLMFDVDAQYSYYPEKRGFIMVRGGRQSIDFNQESGLNGLDNTLSSLFFRRNYINLYEADYISLNHTIEPINGLKIFTAFGYNVRSQLENNTDYSFFFSNSRDFRSNTPVNTYIADDLTLVNDYKTAFVQLNVSYTPRQYYRKYGRRKYNVRSDYPTISLQWRKGISGVFNSKSDYDQIELNINQKIDLGTSRDFHYDVTAGWFPNNKSMHFADFKHFNVKEFAFSFTGIQNAYHLLQTYQPATNSWYANAFVQYNTPYLFLKYLPLLNQTLIQENIYLSYLATPYVKNYTEIGYGLTGIGLIGSAGVFVGFDKFTYSNIGFRVSIPISIN